MNRIFLLIALILACDSQPVTSRQGTGSETGDDTTGGDGTTGDTGGCGPSNPIVPPKACACDPNMPKCDLGTECVPTGDAEVPHACLGPWTFECAVWSQPFPMLQLVPPIFPFEQWPATPGFCPMCQTCEAAEFVCSPF